MASLFSQVQNLVSAKNEPVPVSSLQGKVLGLYFSAHWCPPCRGFTPRLVEWFGNFKQNHARKDELELVFISSDRDQASFDEYHHEMNFHALPYSERELKGSLSSKFGVRGIPTLVFVDAEGNVISKDGRSFVDEDPAGEGFPWTPKPFAELFGDSFINNKGNKFTRADLAGKYIGIYFSAHWCPPCRGFTPQLVKVYNKLKAEGKPFEIIFASSDRDKASFEEYFAEMPWLSLDENAQQRKAGLSKHFEVDGIPSLVILDPELKTITTSGREAVGADLEGAEFPWLPKPLNPLNDAAMGVVNEFPFLLVSTDGSDNQVAAAVAAITPAATVEFAKAEPKLRFLYINDPEEDIVVPIRKFAGITAHDALVIIDVQSNKKYIAADQSITEANVSAFVDEFLSGALKGVPARS